MPASTADTSNPHLAQLISDLGGLSAVSALFAVRGVTLSYQAIQHWVDVGRVPTNRVMALLEIAKEEKVKAPPAEVLAPELRPSWKVGTWYLDTDYSD